MSAADRGVVVSAALGAIEAIQARISRAGVERGQVGLPVGDVGAVDIAADVGAVGLARPEGGK